MIFDPKTPTHSVFNLKTKLSNFFLWIIRSFQKPRPKWTKFFFDISSIPTLLLKTKPITKITKPNQNHTEPNYLNTWTVLKSVEPKKLESKILKLKPKWKPNAQGCPYLWQGKKKHTTLIHKTIFPYISKCSYNDSKANIWLILM